MIDKSIKILASDWYTAGNNRIGIVMIETQFGERKAYINSVSGKNIEYDSVYIADWGAKFPLDAAYELFKHLKPKEDNNG